MTGRRSRVPAILSSGFGRESTCIFFEALAA